jgi:hypothetical protein
MAPNKRRANFAKAAAVLKRLNVGFRRAEEWRDTPPPRRPHPLPIFTSVLLPFAPKEWCELMMSEGRYYVGGCCGTMSATQDILAHSFRLESGWMDIEKLEEIAELSVSHGDGDRDEKPNFKTPGDLDIAVNKWTALDPWQKMAVIWHLVKGCYVPGKPNAPRPNPPPIDHAIGTLWRGLQLLSYHRVFAQDGAAESQKRADRLLALHRLLPALRTLNEGIGGLDPGPFEGYALIDKEGGGGVAENRYGLCIFLTRAEPEKLLEAWRAHDAEQRVRVGRKPIDERICIRPVRVSSERGIEFLDEKIPV